MKQNSATCQIFLLFAVLLPNLGTTQTLQLLKDIFPGTGSSGAREFTTFKGQVYFWAHEDATAHFSLWTTDGTPGGTHQVFYLPDTLTYQTKSTLVKGDSLFFGTTKGNNTLIWASDGTSAGTVLLRSFDYPLSIFTVFKDRLWFRTATDIGYFNSALDSNILVYPAFASLSNSSRDFMYGFYYKSINPYVGKIYQYRANGEPGGLDSLGLVGNWSGGTQGYVSCYYSLKKRGDNLLRSVQNINYDAANNAWPNGGWVGADGFGTLGGNQVESYALCDSFLICYSDHIISPFQSPIERRVSVARSNGQSVSWEPNGFSLNPMAVRDRVFLPMQYELWITNGTEAGTQLVKQLDTYIYPLVPYGNKMLFYTKQNGTNAIWASDGTADSTLKILTLPYLCPFTIDYPLIVNGCKLIFPYNTPGKGSELWAITLPPCSPAVSAVADPSEENELDFRVAPNPASAGSTQVFFDSPVAPPFRLRLSDATGKICWQTEITAPVKSVELPTTGRAPGLYFIGIEKEGRQLSRKLVLGE